MPKNKKLLSKTNLLQIPYHIPPELFLDLIQFLDRNNIEKCQLVCHQWKNIVAKNGSILPLREFEEFNVALHQQKPFWLELEISEIGINGKSHDIPIGNMPKRTRKRQIDSEKMVAKLMSIKYCFFHSIYLCPQLKYKHYAELYNYFDQYNQCLHTHHIVYCLYPNEKLSLLTKIRDFHEKFVHTTQLGINFDQKEQKTLLAKDGIFEALKYSLATEEIILDIYYTSNTENFIKFVGSEKLFQARRFSIEIEEDATDRRFENFCEQFIEMYKNCSNPSNIVRQTTIQTSLPNSLLYEDFENFVTSKSYIIRPSLAYSLVRAYQFLRQDGWCLEVSIYCNFKKPQRVKLEASKIRFKILDPEEYKIENKQEEKNQK